MYPYWSPVEPLKSEQWGVIDIVADVIHHSRLHSWYKGRNGWKTRLFITFNKLQQPGNSNYNDPALKCYHVWFTNDYSTKKESQERLPQAEMDAWWNPRNQPRDAKVPDSYLEEKKLILREEYEMLRTDCGRMFWWLTEGDFEQFVLLHYQKHCIHKTSKQMVLQAEKAFWEMDEDMRRTLQLLQTHLLGIKDVSWIVREYLGLCHYSNFPENHRCLENA